MFSFLILDNTNNPNSLPKELRREKKETKAAGLNVLSG